MGFPGGSAVNNLPVGAGDSFNSWVSKIPWRRKWHPIPVFLPGKSHGQRSLAGYNTVHGVAVRYNLATKQQQSTCTSFKPLKISQDVILLSITCFEGTGYAAGYHLAFLL